jgi:hypothetical protein
MSKRGIMRIFLIVVLAVAGVQSSWARGANVSKVKVKSATYTPYKFDKMAGRDQKLLVSLALLIEDRSNQVPLKQKIQAIARIAEFEGQDITNFLVQMSSRWHDNFTQKNGMSSQNYHSLSTAASRVIQARTGPSKNENANQSEMADSPPAADEYVADKPD